jgi:excinuclease ABC subunit A
VVAHPHLSLARGAVRGWDRDNFYYFQLIKALARHFISRWIRRFRSCRSDPHLDPARQRSRGASISIPTVKGETTHRRHAFEGVIPNMERRYRETESNLVRDDLAKYLSSRPCPSCQGARLTRSARHVFVAGRSVPEIVACPSAARDFFGQLSLPGRAGKSPPKSSRKSASG